MNLADENIFNENPGNENPSLTSIFKEFIYKFQSGSVQNGELNNAYEEIKKYISTFHSTIDFNQIKGISSLIEKSSDVYITYLFSLAELLIPKLNQPNKLLQALLSSRKEQVVYGSLDLIINLSLRGLINIDFDLIKFLADRQEIENNILNSEKALRKISNIIDLMTFNNGVYYDNKKLKLYLEAKDFGLRMLAAKILDLDKTIVPSEITKKILGKSNAEILLPYLTYTCASHMDLLYLISHNLKSPPITISLLECENICGKELIKILLAKLGWKQVNLGISVKQLVGVTVAGSLPLFLTKSEALLLKKFVDADCTSEYYIFTTHSGLQIEKNELENTTNSVSLFRAYNLTHSNLLQEILDLAPLTPQRIKSIINQMDTIVDNYITLFKSYSDECTILHDVYDKIKTKLLDELKSNSDTIHLSTNITRLVQMFEDPHSLGEVHTLHGLKRYLHQKGLQFGFKLVDQSKSPNQSINLVLASGSKILSVIKNISFADFESEAQRRLPDQKASYPIKVVLESFERQLLHGLENFPSVNIFCYGNEVHYFIWFRNHPVFIRIDYSPPLKGGMIDLQYFGVSNYEAADHPNINLDAIKFFFQYLEFDVQTDGTHIHARYDKERALDLAQLCEKVEYLFCLVPYLMDLDWVIGSLNLNEAAKTKINESWAERFVQWGALPYNKFITKDKLGIINEILILPEGEREVLWDGNSDYSDCYTKKLPSDFFDNIFEAIESLRINIPQITKISSMQFGQIYLEKVFFNYLRASLKAGEILESPKGFFRKRSDLFKRIHEAEYFAQIINDGKQILESSIALAQIIAPLEQILKFQTTGSIESFKVQIAPIPLRGETIHVFVLRDEKDIIRLAFFIYESIIFERRDNTSESWDSNVKFSSSELLSILRSNNYTASADMPSWDSITNEALRIKHDISARTKFSPYNKYEDDKIISGLRASRGRAVGKILLGISGRLPEDFDDHILASSSISPEDNTYLFHSAGIVATGGGILSHAGLIANQFNKPALIISEVWKQEIEGRSILVCYTEDFKIEHLQVKEINVTLYCDFRKIENQIYDGDLVVLNADEGYLQLLGHERDTIALYQGLKSLGMTNERLSSLNDTVELLSLRGKKLYLLHQLQKLLSRILEYSIARFVVQEILIGKLLAGNKSTPEERVHLISLILNNENVGKNVHDFLIRIIERLEMKFDNAYATAKRFIPFAEYPFEVVMPRLEVFRLYESIKGILNSIGNNLFPKIEIKIPDVSEIDNISIVRLRELRKILLNKIHKFQKESENREFLRHLYRQLNRVIQLLDLTGKEKNDIEEAQRKFKIEDEHKRIHLSNKFILKPDDGAFELFPLIGWKAANLAELEKLGGKNLVPPWFVISDFAFRVTLESPIKNSLLVAGKAISKDTSLKEAIDCIIATPDISNNEKSLYIKNLWNQVSIPAELRSEIIEAYRKLENDFQKEVTSKKNDLKFFMAVRSSSCEEDAEIAARAGEFETFLFINGEELLTDYLKRTWSSLWTERAIHNRAAFGYQNTHPGGGVIIQRIIHSRVSGVMQTINAAKNDLNEIVINAGLGLGEGVVSGRVAADQIIVLKERNFEKGHLNFNYITADKMYNVVYNSRAGFGTVLMPTLYHQRFRPSIEYVELYELVSIASRLEAAYGYPLDIEFGIEGTKLWILQVRPVAVFLPAFNETLKYFPLTGKA